MKKKNRIISAIIILVCVLSMYNVFSASNYVYYGSPSSQVKSVQEKLKSWGYYNGNVDGKFGYNTEKAVKWFQEKNGLTADGKCGQKTLEKMGLYNLLGSSNSSSSGSSSSGGTYDNSDLMLLAKCIYGEARGESYTGQVAVASVILNRVNHKDFPNSVSGVIYQGGAFDAVSDGQINLTPNDNAINAAKDALSGWDPTSGAIYYYNPKTATNAWIRSRPIITTIGNHVFCK